jgi:hypothetical protein
MLALILGRMAQKEVPYARQTLDSPNPMARLAHRARYRHSLRLGASLAPQGGTVLDFGAGTGEFLHQLGSMRPDLHLLAIEPYMAISHPGIENASDFERIGTGSIDLLTCFETLEHLHTDALDSFVAGAKRVTKMGSSIIISVPIMQGLMLPVKELNRMVLERSQSLRIAAGNDRHARCPPGPHRYHPQGLRFSRTDPAP